MRNAALVVIVLLLTVVAQAKDRPKKAPKNAPGDGKIYQWKAKDGLEYEYTVPRSYDPEKGATLLVSFHGSNLSKGWTFWNHKVGSFCKDRIIVSPEGTTPNGSGGFNILYGNKDLSRAKALIEEIRETFKVTQTFLYGHSQGSFFIHLLAGRYPDLANGLCAHASGVLAQTSLGRAGHGIAIGILHGSRDPVVGYGQGRGANSVYREKRYPMVNFTTWFLGNHWPTAYHTERVILWCEGMTSGSPERVALALAVLAKIDEPAAGHWSAIWQVATRASEMEGVKGAAEIAKAVDALASKHVEALEPRLTAGRPGPWVIHLRRFLDDFEGVPARDEFLDRHERVLDKHESAAISSFRKYYQQRRKNVAKAFVAGVEGFRKGFLHWECDDVASGLAAMAKDAKKHRIRGKVLAAYEKHVGWHAKAVKKGNQEYVKVNRGARLK